METILVKPKDKSEEQLVMDLMKRMNINAELQSEARMAEARENDFASDFELNVEEVKTR